MVKDLYGELLQELGKIIKIDNLHPDKNNSCQIKYKSGITVSIEIDKNEENIVIGCDIAEVPPGRYRENVFREALKANGMPYPRIGTFAYSKQTSHLIFFHSLPLKDISAAKIADALGLFNEKAIQWKQAIDRGETPSFVTATIGKGGGGMFGLKP